MNMSENRSDLPREPGWYWDTSSRPKEGRRIVEVVNVGCGREPNLRVWAGHRSDSLYEWSNWSGPILESNLRPKEGE